MQINTDLQFTAGKVSLLPDAVSSCLPPWGCQHAEALAALIPLLTTTARDHLSAIFTDIHSQYRELHEHSVSNMKGSVMSNQVGNCCSLITPTKRPHSPPHIPSQSSPISPPYISYKNIFSSLFRNPTSANLFSNPLPPLPQHQQEKSKERDQQAKRLEVQDGGDIHTFVQQMLKPLVDNIEAALSLSTLFSK